MGMSVDEGAEVAVRTGAWVVAVDEGGGLNGNGAVGSCRR